MDVPKAEAAAEELRELNPDIEVTWRHARVNEQNIDELLSGFDIILEGGDGPEQRLLANKFAVSREIPMVHVSAQFAYGYVFTMLDPKVDACLHCAFPDLPSSRRGPVPVWGISTGMSGVLGANEVLKILLGHGKLARDQLLTFSNFENDLVPVPIAKNRNCPTCGSKSRISNA